VSAAGERTSGSACLEAITVGGEGCAVLRRFHTSSTASHRQRLIDSVSSTASHWQRLVGSVNAHSTGCHARRAWIQLSGIQLNGVQLNGVSSDRGMKLNVGSCDRRAQMERASGVPQKDHTSDDIDNDLRRQRSSGDNDLQAFRPRQNLRSRADRR
jgi:hypothetical protein